MTTLPSVEVNELVEFRPEVFLMTQVVSKTVTQHGGYVDLKMLIGIPRSKDESTVIPLTIEFRGVTQEDFDLLFQKVAT